MLKNITIIKTKIEELDNIKKSRIKDIIEDAFSQKLIDSFFEEKNKIVYLEKDYSGVGIVIKDIIKDTAYLDIIAVKRASKGKGIGNCIIDAVNKDNKVLFWRCKTRRIANHWYKRISSGYIRYIDNKNVPYNLYFIGMYKDDKRINLALEFLKNRPNNFLP